MNNLEIAQEALKRGEQWHQSSIRAFEDERWNDVVYSYQMAVEQALKAILILYGIEYPKTHDVWKFYLNINKDNLPKWYIDRMEFHAKNLKNLVKLRERSAYGYVEGITKDDFKGDAVKYREAVKEILNDCRTLIHQFSERLKEQEQEQERNDEENT